MPEKPYPNVMKGCSLNVSSFSGRVITAKSAEEKFAGKTILNSTLTNQFQCPWGDESGIHWREAWVVVISDLSHKMSRTNILELIFLMVVVRGRWKLPSSIFCNNAAKSCGDMASRHVRDETKLLAAGANADPQTNHGKRKQFVNTLF